MTQPTRRSALWIGILGSLALTALGVLRAWPPRSVLNRAGDPVFHYWPWSYAHYAYSDIVGVYANHGLAHHLIPYLQHRFEYPPVMAFLIWLTSFGPGLAGYLWLNIVLLAAALAGTIVILRRVRGDRDLFLWALCPILALFVIYNWDVIGILTYALGVLAYVRGRPVLSGLYIGIGISTKLFPAVLLPYLAAELWRRGERRHAASLLVAAVGSFLLLNVPPALANFKGWSWFWRYNAIRLPDPGFWQWVYAHHWLSVASIDKITLGLTVVGGVVLLRAVWRGSLEALPAAGYALVWWLLVNKTHSPQYVIWPIYALVVAGALNRPGYWLMTVSGAFQFGLAMTWLTVANQHSPWLPVFSDVIAPVLAAFQALAYLAALKDVPGALRAPAAPGIDSGLAARLHGP
jgi:hypothetical protein